MIVMMRKHAKWLLWLVAGATILSLLFFMGSGGMRGGGGTGGYNTNLISGTIYGESVTPELYGKMNNDVKLWFLFNYGVWPDHDPSITPETIEQQTYVRMMLVKKAKQMGVHVSEEQVEQAAANYLRSEGLQRALGLHNQDIPFNTFVQQVLAPQNLDAADFENFVRDDLAVEQLQLTFGLSGSMVTPLEATNAYVRENQEYSAQVVFFSATNFLHDINVSPEEAGDYYTNYMADYRLPDRVQVSTVFFSLTNYLGEAFKELGKTNLDLQVQANFDKYGMQAVPDAKTPEEAKDTIRQFLLRHQALNDAATQANIFAQSVFNVSSSQNKPASPEDLLTVARQKGLAVENPAPFSADYGPSEFTAPAAFTRTAFQLTPDSPISEPIGASDGIFVIALRGNLPSEIPPLDQIQPRVTEDLRLREAIMLAQRAGTNFVRRLPIQMAAGKSFAAVAFADGLDPQVLPPFAMSTQEIPELGDHATVNQLKSAVFGTTVGTSSGFKPTDDGGFVLFVESRLPLDGEKMAAELPQFTAELRNRRAQQAFNDWIQHEASRELRNTALGRQMGTR
jgi:SurA N-terminal domain